MGRAKNKKRDFQRKAPLGQGKSARSERKKKKRAQQELQAQLGQLHQAKKRKLQQAGVATDKSTGFAQAISGKSRVNEENLLPLKRFFWPEPKPEEPDDQLKLLRKDLGIKVKGSPIPSPVEQLADSRLPAEFGLFFKGPRGRKLTKPTPIQMQVWPAALCGLDIMGIAPTGSGKTLAYLLPAAVHVAGQESKKENLSPGALVLLPTRELASQVSDQFNGKGGLRQVLKLRCAAIYGGVGKELQLDQLLTSGCPEVLSATPGRLLDLLGLDALTLDSVTLVLDEADRMLQLGFEEQLDAVAKAVRRDRQCLLFSATFPERLRQAADRWMTFPEKTVIRVAAVDVGSVPQDDVGTGTGTLSKSLPEAQSTGDPTGSTESTGSTLTVSKNITQMVHVCAEHKKFRKLARFMDKIRQKEKEEGVRQKALVIIFCNKIQTLKSVSGFLRKHKHHCEALHSGIPQAKRENALNMFKAGQMQVLVATDVAARGLHVKHLRYVVNYDFPSNLEQYCHRIGRTGRDGEAGTAYSFFTRNLAPLSRDLIQLLERSDQEVDPNLRALAEGKVQQPGEKSSAEEEASEEVVDEASADEAPPLGPSGGGLRIMPRKRGGVEDESSEEDVSEGPSIPVAPVPTPTSSGPKKVKKVKRRRKGGAKNR